MILLIRPPRPQILEKNAEQWTKRLLELKKSQSDIPDSLIRNYRNKDIKIALKEASFEKCIYCESKQLHIAHGDIEHIKPKSKFPELTFEWENLGFVCRICNEKKLDQYDDECQIINPFIDDPSTFLSTKGPLIHHLPGNNRAKITVLMLDLNRAELLERRNEKVMELLNLLEAAITSHVSLRPFLLKHAKEFINRDKEYSFVLSRIYREYLLENSLQDPY